MKPLKNNIFCGKHAPEDHRYNVEFYIMKASVQCSLPMCQTHLSSLETLVCCIVDAANVCSLPSSSHRPPWCNTSPKTSLQPRNPIVLHQWCNIHLLASLFLLHSTVMQHLSSSISPASKSYCVASTMQQTSTCYPLPSFHRDATSLTLRP